MKAWQNILMAIIIVALIILIVIFGPEPAPEKKSDVGQLHETDRQEVIAKADSGSDSPKNYKPIGLYHPTGTTGPTIEWSDGTRFDPLEVIPRDLPTKMHVDSCAVAPCECAPPCKCLSMECDTR